MYQENRSLNQSRERIKLEEVSHTKSIRIFKTRSLKKSTPRKLKEKSLDKESIQSNKAAEFFTATGITQTICSKKVTKNLDLTLNISKRETKNLSLNTLRDPKISQSKNS